MAYDEHLAERVEGVLKARKTNFYEKKMFGGTCFMVNDKMCIGVVKDNLMVRLDPETADALTKQPGVRPMDFTGRPLKGYLYVEPTSVDMEEDLMQWVDRCLAFNPVAKASKKR